MPFLQAVAGILPITSRARFIRFSSLRDCTDEVLVFDLSLGAFIKEEN
jgi:hypothetical protein